MTEPKDDVAYAFLVPWIGKKTQKVKHYCITARNLLNLNV